MQAGPHQAGALRITENAGDLPGVRLLERVDAHGHVVPARRGRVAIVGRQHGNEPVGEVVIDRLLQQAPEHLRAGSLLLLVANLDARALDVRHTPEGVDMNRLWDAATLARLAAADPASLCSEERRAASLAPWLLSCDVVLDLHSTSRPSTPHLIVRDDLQHAEVARRLGVRRLVTGVHENEVLAGGVLSNVGLEPCEPSTRLGFTLEAGQHLDTRNNEAAWDVAVRLLAWCGMWDAPAPEPAGDVEVYEILERVSQAPRGATPWVFVGYEGGPAGAGRSGPPRALASFDAIEADEVVLRRGHGEVRRAEAPFTMLMPATAAGAGEDLYFVAQRRETVLDGRLRTPAAAREEAEAIERLLDVLAWDEAARGTLRAPLTSRRVLDAAAELVSRVTRLPVGHPHRRLVWVGRGAETEAEGTVEALRLRHALRCAVERGVSVERHVLLRGATLAGLEEAADDLARGVVVRWSERQSSALSLLVAGDLELARTTGELRHVAVALWVGAVTLEEGDDAVAVQEARAGIVGARPALLEASRAWIASLLEEDRHLRGAEAPEAVLARVRASLVDGWRERLRVAVPGPSSRPKGALGRWLARTMTASGILDAGAVLSWLVRPSGDADWTLDPARLSVRPAAPAPRPARAWPPVLHAEHADADTLERWVGWRRRLGEVEAVPGSHGRDLEVLVGSDAVRTRVAAWFDDAREAAVRAPGRWLVAVAGDGQDARRERDAVGERLQAAHAALLREGTVRYLRAQHARGTHLGWWRHLLRLVVARPQDASPVGLAFDAEHTGGVHVLVVASRATGEEPAARSLEGWTIERVLLLFAAGGADARFHLALCSDRLAEGRLQDQLGHFARVHVERLLRQSAFWIQARPSPLLRVQLETAVRQLLIEQVHQVVGDAGVLRDLPSLERATWVAGRLGLADRAWAGVLAEGLVAGRPPDEIAREGWRLAAEPEG